MDDHTSPQTPQQTREIPLNKGQVAIVDAADYEWLSRWTWRLQIDSKTGRYYARRTVQLSNGKRKAVMLHREITGAPAHIEVDHHDGNGLNNTRLNLRLCSHQQNIGNSRKRHDNSSGYKGVSFHKASCKWVAQITVNPKRAHLGLFDTPELAARAYDEAARKHFGEFAKLNFP